MGKFRSLTVTQKIKLADTEGWTLIKIGEEAIEDIKAPPEDRIKKLRCRKDFLRKTIFIELDHFSYLEKELC